MPSGRYTLGVGGGRHGHGTGRIGGPIRGTPAPDVLFAPRVPGNGSYSSSSNTAPAGTLAAVTVFRPALWKSNARAVGTYGDVLRREGLLAIGMGIRSAWRRGSVNLTNPALI